MANLIHELLDEQALRVADKLALLTQSGQLSYAELALASARVATWLHQQGIGRGERIALLLPNGCELVIALLAASRIGATFFILNLAIKPFHLLHILADAEPALLISTRALAATLPALAATRLLLVEDGFSAALATPAAPPPFPGISLDPACLIYTSGSTGLPKAVICSHRNVLFATAAIQRCLALREDERIGNVLPLSFDVGLYQVFLCLLSGATLALWGEEQAGPLLLRTLYAWQVTGLPCVPSLVDSFVRMGRRSPQQLPRLRLLTNTGAHLSRAAIAAVLGLLPECRVFVMFGLTECKRVAILPPEDLERKPHAVGKPLPDTECLIVGAEGQVLGPGEVGELVVRGPHVMQGYWRAEELTARRFRRWGEGSELALYSGDWCSLDEEGYLYFHGRGDELYKQSGYRLSAQELELAASEVAGVRLAALVPPSERSGAVLFVAGAVTAEQVMEGLGERLEGYKLPARVEVREALPLTPNGKLDKAKLREWLEREVQP